MISVRLSQEIAAPAGERVERLPVYPGELVIPGIAKVASITVEEVDVDGQTYEMKTIADAFTSKHIRISLLGTTDHLTNGAIVALTMDIVEKSREEPSK